MGYKIPIMFAANTYITSVYKEKANYFPFFLLLLLLLHLALVSLSSLALLHVGKRLCAIFYLRTYLLIRRKSRDCILCIILNIFEYIFGDIVCAYARQPPAFHISQ